MRGGSAWELKREAVVNPRISRSLAFAVACIAGTAAPGAAKANVSASYTYTGVHYTYSYPSNGCLKQTMHLSMKIVLSERLAANLSNQSVTAKSWAIDDGLHSFKDTQAKAIVPLQAQFSTDDNANITGWSVNSYYYAKNGIDLLYTTHSSGTAGDYSGDYKCKTASVGSNFTPGTWPTK
jgi:hypothetical protein